MIQSAIEMLGGWSWWVLGLLLLGVEVVAPGFFFLWFGIAAILIGISTLLFAWPWQLQVLGFAVLSVIAAVVGRRFMGQLDTPSADPNLNQRAERLKGRTFVLEEPVVEGSGRVRVEDSVWRVRGPDSPAGTRVVVTGSEGTVLLVQRA